MSVGFYTMKAAGMFPAVPHTVSKCTRITLGVVGDVGVKTDAFRKKERGIMHHVVSCSSLKVLNKRRGAHDIACKKSPGTG